MPVLRYSVAMAIVLLVGGTVGGLLQGQGPESFIGAAFALVWVGWLTILLMLPLFLALLWLLPKAERRRTGVPLPFLGAAIGFMVWLSTIAAIFVFATVTGNVSQDPPPTAAGFAIAALVVGGVGAYAGLIEGFARQRSRRGPDSESRGRSDP